MPDGTLKSILPWQNCECGCRGTPVRIGLYEFVIESRRGNGLKLSGGHVPKHYIATVANIAEAEAKILAMPQVQRELTAMREIIAAVDTQRS